MHAASQLQKGVTDILITCICQLYSFVMGERQELSIFVLQVVEWACIVAPVNTYLIHTHTHPFTPHHPSHTHAHAYTPPSPHPLTTTHLLLHFSNILCILLNDYTHLNFGAKMAAIFFFNANYTVKRCNIPLNIVRVRYTRCVFKMLRFGIIISILGNNIPQFMILAAILFLCKLGGQDIRIIFGIHHFWTQHTQIDLKSYRYRFYLDLHLRCLYS